MNYIGHDEAWRSWRDAMAGSRMHHGWILAGRRGVGKSAFALAAARELVAEPGIPQPAGEHPDIITLSHPPKDDKEARKRDDGKPYELARNIKIEQIRRLQQRLTTRPTLGSRRVIIIDPADDMEAPTANALLKSLEEPPRGTTFILIAHRVGRLLPTIRSRCRTLSFPEVAEADMRAILAREAPQADADMTRAAIAAAAGSPGAAIDFVAMDLGRIHTVLQEIAAQGDPDFSRRGQLASAIGARPDRQRQMATLDLARAVLAEKMRVVPRAAIPALVETHAELMRLSAQVPIYNFDAGLLVMEIGTLLSQTALPREAANV